MKVKDTFIGKDVNGNFITILETENNYFVQYWDDIHAQFAIDPIPSETALMFIDNASASGFYLNL